MRKLVLVPILTFFILLSAFSEKSEQSFRSTTKKVGVYDRDSLMQLMPGYQKNVDSLRLLQKMLNDQLDLMTAEVFRKQNQLDTDSLQMSPLIRELKRSEIIDMKQRVADFNFQAGEYLADANQNLLQPMDTTISFAAKNLAKKKKLDMVLDKKEFIGYKTANPGCKVKNVMADMKIELGISKPK